MSQLLNLKELERIAFRRTWEDGLFDIYLGGNLASFAAFGFTVFPGSETKILVSMVYYLIGISLSSLVFWLGKKYITVPRIGLVQFGPARKKRARDLLLALAVIVAIQALAVLFQFGFLKVPALREWLAPILGDAGGNRVVVASVAAIFVAPGMLLVAYFADMPRGYYNAVVMALAIFLMVLFDSAWWMVMGGALMMLPGLVQFVTFLQRYPLEKISDERP